MIQLRFLLACAFLISILNANCQENSSVFSKENNLFDFVEFDTSRLNIKQKRFEMKAEKSMFYSTNQNQITSELNKFLVKSDTSKGAFKSFILSVYRFKLRQNDTMSEYVQKAYQRINTADSLTLNSFEFFGGSLRSSDANIVVDILNKDKSKVLLSNTAKISKNYGYQTIDFSQPIVVTDTFFISLKMATIDDSFMIGKLHNQFNNYNFGDDLNPKVFKSSLPFKGDASIVATPKYYNNVIGVIQQDFDFFIIPKFTYTIRAKFTISNLNLCKGDSVFFTNNFNSAHITNPMLNYISWRNVVRGDALFSSAYYSNKQSIFKHIGGLRGGFALDSAGNYKITASIVFHPWSKMSPQVYDSTVFNVSVSSLPEIKLTSSDSLVYVTDKPLTLEGLPSGGVFSGEGVTSNVFNPSNLSLGYKDITYTLQNASGVTCSSIYKVLVVDSTKRILPAEYDFFDTLNSGLNDNTINCLTYDSKNILWIGTNNGLTSFDGKNWVTYTTLNSQIPGDTISSIAEDMLGNIWVGTNNSISKLEANATWNTLTVGKPKYSMKIKGDNAAWVGSSEGLFKVNIDTTLHFDRLKSKLSSDTINAIAVDQKNVWLGTDFGLNRFNILNKSVDKVYTTSNSKVIDNKVNTLFLDGKEDLWIGTNAGLSKFYNDKSTNKGLVENYDRTNSGLMNDTIVSISANTQGDLIVGTKNGFTLYDGLSWDTYLSKKRNRADYSVISSVFDSFGNKWVGTKNGLYKLKNKTTSLTDEQPIKSTISIYPNPSNGSFVLKSSNSFVEKNADILNVLGKVVAKVKVESSVQQIDLKSLENGTYFMKINDDNEVIQFVIE